ncbi:MAG: hypothetical protein HZA53_11685 [Planctomycetes bacterium]|nr:hypothetical protein [Planctomycetota bacterium]
MNRLTIVVATMLMLLGTRPSFGAAMLSVSEKSRSVPGPMRPVRGRNSLAEEWKIPSTTLNAAAEKAMAASGRHVDIKYSVNLDSDSGVLVTQLEKKTGPLAGTIIQGGSASAIVIYPQQIREKIPGIDTLPGLWEDLLVLVLIHELEHVPTGQGGGGVPDKPKGSPPNTADPCAHMKLYQSDASRACEKIQSIIGNESIPANERCKKRKALCKFYEYLEGLGNTAPNVNAAPNCDPPVPVQNGKIISPCSHCTNIPTCE